MVDSTVSPLRRSGLLGVGLACLAAICASPLAYGACQSAQPVIGQITYYSDCLDAFPVAAFLAVVGSADTINSNGIQFICEDNFGFECSSNEGVAGDGRISIEFDWSNPDLSTTPWTYPIGCPNPAGIPGIGRNFAQVVCNDGAGAIVTVDYDIGLAGYEFDYPTRWDPAPGGRQHPFSS